MRRSVEGETALRPADDADADQVVIFVGVERRHRLSRALTVTRVSGEHLLTQPDLADGFGRPISHNHGRRWIKTMLDTI